MIVNPLALLHNLTDQELHLAKETEEDQTRLQLLQYFGSILNTFEASSIF